MSFAPTKLVSAQWWVTSADLASGTLTTNQMSVARFLTVGEGSSFAEYKVGGTTFAPIGSITLDGKHAEKSRVRTAPVNKLVEICAVCNDAKISYNAVSLS